MLRRSIIRPIGVALGVGSALTGFGLAAPAVAATNCAGGVTVDAVEADIRAAIAGGETLICVNPGQIDMSSTGTDLSATPFGYTGADLTIIALGEVVLDGGGNAPGAFLANDASASSLTVDGFTFIDFTGPSGVVSTTKGGTLSVLNSTFSGNAGGPAVYGNTGEPLDVVVDNTVFDNNESPSAQVMVTGYAGVLTVNNSSFIDNEGRSIWSEKQGGSDQTSKETVLSGNYFENNNTQGGATVLVSTESSDIYNNTFVGNVATNSDATALHLVKPQESRVWFNTFLDNYSNEGSVPSVFVRSDVIGADFVGNIWANNESGFAIDADNPSDVNDGGGNFSTIDDSVFLDSSSSQVNVSLDSLDLAGPADNGGDTKTVAIGDDSIAIDAVNPADFGGELESLVPVDQRGDSRNGFYDAGAFEYSGVSESGEEIALTGVVDGNVIGLVGGGVLAAGITVAMVSAVLRRKYSA